MADWHFEGGNDIISHAVNASDEESPRDPSPGPADRWWSYLAWTWWSTQLQGEWLSTVNLLNLRNKPSTRILFIVQFCCVLYSFDIHWNNWCKDNSILVTYKFLLDLFCKFKASLSWSRRGLACSLTSHGYLFFLSLISFSLLSNLSTFLSPL